jgi:hypothetical protein
MCCTRVPPGAPVAARPWRAVVAGGSLIFAANRFRCPLTQLAEKIGAADGSVTDIWLPRWFAHNLPAIHVPLLAVAAYLNGRNLRDRQRHTQANPRPESGAG